MRSQHITAFDQVALGDGSSRGIEVEDLRDTVGEVGCHEVLDVQVQVGSLCGMLLRAHEPIGRDVHMHVGEAGDHPLAAAIDAHRTVGDRTLQGGDPSVRDHHGRIHQGRATVDHGHHVHVFDDRDGGRIRMDLVPIGEWVLCNDRSVEREP
jgi:hypothetical protein